MLNLLPSNPDRTFYENLIKVFELEEDEHVLKKVKNILQIQNFDVSPQSIAPLENYWTEDIQLMKILFESDMSSFLDIYDELETCINPDLNNSKLHHLS